METMQQHPLLTLCGLLFAAWSLARLALRVSTPSRLKRPPGPKGYPIIGNLLVYPNKNAWLVYDRWFKEYGDMVYFEVVGQPILILGSLKRTTDLFETRSSKYSDRPCTPMVSLIGFEKNLALMPYGSSWRRHRRAFHQYFHPNIIPQYHPAESRQIPRFLGQILRDPKKFASHTRTLLGSIIIDVTYGIQVLEENDPLLSDADLVVKNLSTASVPGKFIVDKFPILKYLPRWVPGAEFKKFAEIAAALYTQTSKRPFESVMKEMKNGTAKSSVVSKLIDALPEASDPNREIEEDIALNTASIAYLAGADTTLGSALTFILAMTRYPEIQRKAQNEIDEIVGHGRLPDFSDRSRLTYVNAIIKEVIRWHQSTPLALPHATSEDDVYEGYFIPKGTIVMGCSWSILHDPNVYPDPFEFNPGRFIKNGQVDASIPDPSIAAFGYGRRICPGRYFSNDTLYAMVSSTLAMFDVMPPKDEAGNSVLPAVEFSDGILSQPEQFDCIIKPRSPECEALIRNLSDL